MVIEPKNPSLDLRKEMIRIQQGGMEGWQGAYLHNNKKKDKDLLRVGS